MPYGTEWNMHAYFDTGISVPEPRNCDDKDIGSSDLSRMGNLARMLRIWFDTGLEEVLDGAFDDCAILISVEFPCSIKTLGSNLFNCPELEAILIESSNPPTISNSTFDNTNDCPIYVYLGFIDKYKAAWPQLASRIRPIEDL